MLYKKLVLGLVVVVALATVFVGVSAQAQDDTAQAQTFIGKSKENADEFVAVVIDGENVTVYICDGNMETNTVSIAEWFVGTLGDTGIDITANSGNRVEVSLTDSGALGKFTFTDGSAKEFEAELVDHNTAGLFRSEFTIGETNFVGGWLVMADGAVRGAIRNAATGELAAATFIDFRKIPDKTADKTAD